MPKYLLIDSKSIHIPGNEQSRTNPGHGYPSLKWFEDEKELLEYMETWGSDIEDPLIYEISGRIRIQKKLTTSLSRH